MPTLIATLCYDDNNDRGFPFSWWSNDLVTKKGGDGLNKGEAFYSIIEIEKEMRN